MTALKLSMPDQPHSLVVEEEKGTRLRTDFRDALAACQDLLMLTRMRDPDPGKIINAVRAAETKFASRDARVIALSSIGSIERICAAGNQRNALVQTLETGSLDAAELLVTMRRFTDAYRMSRYEGNALSRNPVYPAGTGYVAVAAQHHRPDCIEMLARHNFNLAACNPRGQTALDYAVRPFENTTPTGSLNLSDFERTVSVLTKRGIKFTASPFEKTPAQKVKEALGDTPAGLLLHKIQENTVLEVNPQNILKRALRGVHL